MHVLSTPPAFVLSQDQTLRECSTRETPNDKSGTTERNSPHGPQRPRCCINHQRNLDQQTTNHGPKDGVSTYLALTFGTLLSSQGTDASFERPSGLPPGASLRFLRLYHAHFREPDPCRRELSFSPSGVITTLEHFPGRFQIGLRTEFRDTNCLLYTSPSPRDGLLSRMPSSA